MTTQEHESAAFNQFRLWYEQEIDGLVDADPLEAHTQSIAQAIQAVYYLGFSNGHTQGLKEAQNNVNKCL